MKLECVTTAFR